MNPGTGRVCPSLPEQQCPATSSIGGRSGPPGTPGRPFPRISVANGGGTTAHRGCPYLLSSFTETTSPPSREEKKEMEKLWSW